MKLFLAILPIVMMIQLSMAGPLARSKRDTSTDFIESVYDYYVDVVPKTVAISEHALKKMPTTDAYATYRKDLESYLEDVKESKSTPGNCYQKSFALDQKFNKLLKRYGEDDAPKEAQEVILWLLEIVEYDWAEKEATMFESFLDVILAGNDEAPSDADAEKLKKKLLTVC